MGLAACSADCETMWQIGIDVLSEYRRRGIASTLTSRLALTMKSSSFVNEMIGTKTCKNPDFKSVRDIEDVWYTFFIDQNCYCFI